jgi:hypothetical protein
MPLKKCGKNGYKWGDSGKCYTGPDGKKKALKQGLAIEGADNFKSIMKKSKGDFHIDDLFYIKAILKENEKSNKKSFTKLIQEGFDENKNSPE